MLAVFSALAEIILLQLECGQVLPQQTGKKGDIGLLWIDAHMDAHTPATSPSGNIHGMPLASCWGSAILALPKFSILSPKFKPKYSLVGVRSYEMGELELLRHLNVRVFFMEEIEERGLHAVLHEALEIVTQNTAGYGISFDLDSIDPEFVQAVGTPVRGGIHPQDFLHFLPALESSPLLALELVEYNPSLDGSGRTLQSSIIF